MIKNEAWETYEYSDKQKIKEKKKISIILKVDEYQPH